MQENRTYFEANLPDYFVKPPPNQDMAIASLVIGIISCVTLSLAGLGVIAGVVLGIKALRKAKAKPEEFGGEGLATAGIIVSVCSLVLTAGIVAAIFVSVPKMMAGTRRLANEEVARSNMRFIESSERTYHDYITPGSYASLDELRSKNLINYADVSNGYRFRVELKGDAFEAFAIPEKYPETGLNSFWVTRDSDVVSSVNSGQDVPPNQRHRIKYAGIGPGRPPAQRVSH